MLENFETRSIRRAKRKKTAERDIEINKPNMRVAIYIRVSTEEQKDGYSLEFQEKACRDYAESKGWDAENAIVYCDPGYSGQRDDRPDFNRMIQDASLGKFDILIAHKLDRFMRNMLLCSQKLDLLIRVYRIAVVFFGDNLEFVNDKTNDIQFTMFSWFAEYYVNNLSRETAKGKKTKAANGKHNGSAPFGYVFREGSLHPDENEKIIVRDIFKRYSSGLYSDQDIADYVNSNGFLSRNGNSFTKGSMLEILQNKLYCGYVQYHENSILGKHEPIISEDLYEKCLAIRKSRRFAAPRNNQEGANVNERFMLQRIIRCADCGRPLRVQTKGESNNFYLESPNHSNVKCIYHGKSMSVRSYIPEEQTEEILGKIILPQEWLSSIMNKKPPEIGREEILAKLVNLHKKLETLNENYDNFELILSDKKKESYKNKREMIQSEAEILKKALSEHKEVNSDEQQAIFSSLQDFFPLASMEEKSDIVHLIFSAIYFQHASKRIVAFTPTDDFAFLFTEIAEMNGWNIAEDGRFSLND